jgi:ribonuclease J
VSYQPEAGPLRVVFLGGMGEIGRNMLALEYGDSRLLVDCGVSFPTEEMLGVDLVIPDFTYLRNEPKELAGIVLTHGHEDHVGALPWLLQDMGATLYGTALTLGMARRRLNEQGVKPDEARAIEAPSNLEIGPFGCTFVTVAHSIPGALALAVDTPAGRLVYTGDFKIDDDPIDGRRTDLDAFRRLGDQGVDVLLSDSTNALVGGRSRSERILEPALREIMAAARRRIVVSCFASNIHRIQQICDIAAELDRKVAIIGRSMIANVEVARELGHLSLSGDLVIPVNELHSVRPERSVVICTGAQGQPFSALALMAEGAHKKIRIEPDDVVILSAKPIPGNEPTVHRVLNAFYRAGATVHDPETSLVHVSGHAAAEDLREVLQLVRPRHFVPVHGELRHLYAHARIARAAGWDDGAVSIAEDGDVLTLEDGVVRRAEPVPAGKVLVDGVGAGEIGPVVLRDRRHLAGDGVLICIIVVDAEAGEILAGPDLISRGFVHVDESQDLLNEAVEEVEAALDRLTLEQSRDWTEVKRTARRALGEFVWKNTRRRPMILPLVMEV